MARQREIAPEIVENFSRRTWRGRGGMSERRAKGRREREEGRRRDLDRVDSLRGEVSLEL
jgi:hypothetical protein